MRKWHLCQLHLVLSPLDAPAFTRSQLNRGLHFHANSNGVRAPPWRQVHGDLGYLVAKPLDGERIFILAHVEGFVQIKGLNAQGQMDDTRVGESFATLSGLLRSKSPHFASRIDRQDFRSSVESSAGTSSAAASTVLSNATRTQTKADIQRFLNSEPKESSGRGSSDNSTSREAHGNSLRRTYTNSSSSNGSSSSSSRHSRRALQPSQKWASLGLGKPVSSTANAGASGTSRKAGGGAAGTTPATVSAASKKATGASLGHHSSSNSALSHDSRENTGMITSAVFQPRRHPREHKLDDFEESSEEEEEEEVEERRVQAADLPPEYWSIHKLVKYLSGGNQTATVIALCSLRDFDLTSESCQFAIRDVGGLDVLINLLDTEDVKCKIGALHILADISLNVHVKRAIADMNGMRPLVGLLEAEDDRLQGLAALTIANCAKYPRNRRMVRFYEGIEKAVALLRAGVEEGKEEVARCGATALWSCSKSGKNKARILQAGAVPLLAQLLQSDNIGLLVPVVGVLEECASDPTYRDLIRQKRMVPFLVSHLSKDNKTLQAHSAMAIFKCAEDTATRELVRQCNGLEPLVRLLRFVDDTSLLEGVSGAIWKCSLDPANVKIFSDLKAVEYLVALLSNPSEAVLTNVAGALSELTKNPDSCRLLRTAGGIEPLVNLLSGTNPNLLINATRAVGVAARSKENMDAIDRLDGVRLLWSLLKADNVTVQAEAAWAICPCIENARDAGEMVRSFVGGLELVVGLLRSEDHEVLASVCAALGYIAKDEENLAVITDHGVVPMLSKLTRTTNDKLRCHLAEAMANCCVWGNNRVAFGKEDAVAPLSKYLKSKVGGGEGDRDGGKCGKHPMAD